MKFDRKGRPSSKSFDCAMSTSARLGDFERDQSQYLGYRSFSSTAVVTLILALLSLPALLFPMLLVVPFWGMIQGIYAVRLISRRATELGGLKTAWSGLVLCGVCFFGGVLAAVTTYAMEVPEGYERISFLQLQPDKSLRSLPVSPRALELNGKRIFVKGYVYPDDRGSELKQFVLIPDLGTCCFGGQPKLTDMIEVTLEDPLRTDYSLARHRLGGVLKVDTRLKPISGLQGVYYQLKADYLDGEFAK
jgi:hypothetical protein